eukprot:690055-Pyramimonas_sp.AAC.1
MCIRDRVWVAPRENLADALLAAAAGRPAGGGRARPRIPPPGDLSSGAPSACSDPLIRMLVAAGAGSRIYVDAPVR